MRLRGAVEVAVAAAAVALLALSLSLGILASRRAVGVHTHLGLGLAAALFSAVVHFRNGGFLNFAAVALLGATVVLGYRAYEVASTLPHLVLSVVAVAVSASAHVNNIAEIRGARGERS